MFFTFPEDARWNADAQAVEFGVGIGEYEGVVRVPRQIFRRFIDGTVTPASCLEAYHLHRTRLELVVERKLRNRQLTDDGNVEITGRDLRAPWGQRWHTQITHTGTPGNGRKLEADESARPSAASRCGLRWRCRPVVLACG